jgi:hypothetical protein
MKRHILSIAMSHLIGLIFIAAAHSQTVNLQLQNDYAIGTGSATPRFATGDLNRDGRPDIVTSTSVAGQPVSVFLNNGTGGFAAPIPISVSYIASAVAIGDFNNDGNPDLAIGSTNNTIGTLGIRLGNGTGNFPNEVATGLVQAVTDISAADFNLDGNTDLIMTNNLGYAAQPTNAARLILGNGNGGFGSPVNFGVGASPVDLEVKDFNNDGRADVAVVSFAATDNLVALINNGAGGFVPTTPISLTSPSSSAKLVALDFNRDCATDLAVSTGDAVFVLFNTNATFGTGFSFSISNQGAFVPASLAAGDFNLDRFPDIAIGRLNTAGGFAFNIVAGDGAGGILGGTPFSLASTAITDQLITLDANLDGRTDVAMSRRTNSFSLYNGNSALIKRTAGDFDGDGRSDLSVFRPTAGDWFVQQTTRGFFGTHWGLNGDAPTPSDFDGDFKTDIAVWRGGGVGDPDRSYFFILRSSNNTLQSEQFGRTGDNPSVVGDWDGDGKSDVAVFRDRENAGNPQSFFYYRPSASPGIDFNALPWGTSGDKPVRGDFDGDGKLDLAVFRPSNTIYYVLQSSNGQVALQNWGFSSDERFAADYDGDGKTDLAVTRPTADSPPRRTWYVRNSSNGSLTAFVWGLQSDVLVPADYNGDGRSEPGIYRPTDQRWYVPPCAVSDAVNTKFGTTGDVAATLPQN